MEHIHHITEILGITDKNIIVTDYSKQKDHTVLYATLDYQPPTCPNCKGKMIKYDFQKPSNIPLLDCQGMPTTLILKKRRFQCKDCRKVRVSETSIVKKNHQISHDINRKITQLLVEKNSMTEIARRLHVSTSTVIGRLKLVDTATDFSSLPEVISWDEYAFKRGKMSFIAQDYNTSKILAILDGRQGKDILEHFERYDLKVRQQVKIITMDMFSPYYKLVKRLFPKAKIVLDRFHIVQHLNRAMNNFRIQLMKQFKPHSKEYKHLKYYWKLFLKDSRKLSPKRRYSRVFRSHLTNQEILNKILSYSKELKYHYELFQMLLFHFSQKNVQHFYGLVEEELHQVHPIFQGPFRTFLNHKDKIINAIELPYSNGRLEATNNLIKVIKRNAFGFRNFSNFKKRILLSLNTKREKTHMVLSRVNWDHPL